MNFTGCIQILMDSARDTWFSPTHADLTMVFCKCSIQSREWLLARGHGELGCCDLVVCFMKRRSKTTMSKTTMRTTSLTPLWAGSRQYGTSSAGGPPDTAWEVAQRMHTVNTGQTPNQNTI